jgi:hypothetical protein
METLTMAAQKIVSAKDSCSNKTVSMETVAIRQLQRSIDHCDRAVCHGNMPCLTKASEIFTFTSLFSYQVKSEWFYTKNPNQINEIYTGR